MSEQQASVKRVAVLTSGGDAPGMNAAIRAVTRTAVFHGLEVFGVRNGFDGLLDGQIKPLGARDVGGILQHGGTVLGSARCDEFHDETNRRAAIEDLRRRGIDALVVIGGSGSQTGSAALQALGFPVIGIASTIDNDLCGSDVTLGVDTALNVAIDAIDKLRVTASSHKRASAVETMGRGCGYLALMAGIAGGAECVVIPEVETTPEEVVSIIRGSFDRGKTHSIIVLAEGAACNLDRLIAHCRDNEPELATLRATRLGHIQRGGTPTAFDRILGSRFGHAAIECLRRGESGLLVGWIDGKVQTTPLEDIAGKPKQLDEATIRLTRVLAR